MEFPIVSQAPEQANSFELKSNESLRDILKEKLGDSIPGRFISSYSSIPSGGVAWSSSFLAEYPGRPVPKLKPKDPSKVVELYEATCRWTAYNVQDGQPFTLWCEGVAGSGIGEVVLAPIYLEIDHFYIVPGFYSPRVYEEYSRTKKIVVHYLQPARILPMDFGGFVMEGVIYSDKQEIELSDVSGSQKISISNHKRLVELAKEIRGKVDRPLFGLVAIEIVSVTEGTKYKEHTCISEIGNQYENSYYVRGPLK
ncbi:hypothetical protein LPTSP4_24710 [Leptospira ryugenii]|uniref:NAD glycohydrolase translocation F5/8 type C domain-containing protein n=1 Tax=Leptospira ryugenii TaxID=1917863 RepID=A0A2P2E214_9LEPT|nr:hypothetical protein [Leptospira ryugenii]GBF50943.1 hypothetical protein LPTSP4_24710 [Leptospira ryugenii]